MWKVGRTVSPGTTFNTVSIGNGFEGHVVSDCWAILDFHEHHHVTESVEESAAMAVNNGCDLNCGSAFLHLQEAYEKGLVSEEVITEAVERLMEVRIRLGMMKDYPSPYEDITYDKVECPEHVKLSVEAARRSLVLLKNENAFLPLDKNKIQTVAVVGEKFEVGRDALVGNYVGTSSRYITPLEGIQQYVGDYVRKYSLNSSLSSVHRQSGISLSSRKIPPVLRHPLLQNN